MTITRPVGDIFKDGNVELKVIEANNCKGCYYRIEDECKRNTALTGYCSTYFRSNNVVFKQISSEIQPKTESQEKQILNYLQSGKSITQLEALNMFDCMRLSARIYRLKKRGHNIKTEMIEENGKRFAKYYL